MNSRDDPSAAGGARREYRPGNCLSEKLAHRALADRRRATPCMLSEATRDRLYARMFPRHLCLGADTDAEPDPIA